MGKEDAHCQLSAEAYLEKHHVLIYIEDAVMQFLATRNENSKVNAAKFLKEYFLSVKDGSQTLFREYTFVSATPYNRACFVHTFWKAFRNIGRKGDLLGIAEYHTLLCLLCADFPLSLVQQTARIILLDDAVDCLISFSDFIYAFQLQFYFEEFIKRCSDVYRGLLEKRPAGHETVIVPTSDDPTTSATHSHESAKNLQGTTKNYDGVETTHFYRILISNCEKSDINHPPRNVLRKILSVSDRVTFYGFLMALSKSKALNAAIGKLAEKDKLLEPTEQELTACRPQYHHYVTPGQFTGQTATSNAP